MVELGISLNCPRFKFTSRAPRALCKCNLVAFTKSVRCFSLDAVNKKVLV